MNKTPCNLIKVLLKSLAHIFFCRTIITIYNHVLLQNYNLYHHYYWELTVRLFRQL